MIKMLQHAHAAEWAAYWAYEGHWKSLKDPEQIDEIQKIQRDEFEHINIIKNYLRKLDAEPSKLRDAFFTNVGKIIGLLCKVTGWRMPMIVAGLMEHIGTTSYDKMAKHASDIGMNELSLGLQLMARVEKEHQLYFKNLLK